MKYLIASIFALLLPLSALAQEEDTTKIFVVSQVCAPFDVAFTTAFEAGETLLFTGTGNQISTTAAQMFSGGMFFFTNQDSGSWSMVYVYGDGTACLVGNGSGFAPYSPPSE